MRTEWLVIPLLMGCDDIVFEPHEQEGGGIVDSGYDGTLQIINGSCLSGCHDAASQAAGLDLETDFCGSTIGVPSVLYPDAGNLIEAGNASSSVLFLKMQGADGVGGVMPISGALDGASQSVVGDWIDAGADCSSDTSGGDTGSGGGDTGGSGGGGDTGVEADYTNSAIVAEVGPQCSGCHGPGGTALPQLGEDPGNLINQKSNYYGGKTLVVPGDPEASFFYQKVRGNMETGHGDVMPPYGDGLSTDELTLIYGWILELEG